MLPPGWLHWIGASEGSCTPTVLRVYGEKEKNRRKIASYMLQCIRIFCYFVRRNIFFMLLVNFVSFNKLFLEKKMLLYVNFSAASK